MTKDQKSCGVNGGHGFIGEKRPYCLWCGVTQSRAEESQVNTESVVIRQRRTITKLRTTIKNLKTQIANHSCVQSGGGKYEG